MGCRRTESTVQAYLEGETRGAERQAFEDHLTRCVACQARVEEYQELLGMLRTLKTVEVPELFAKHILAALRHPFIPRVWVAVAASLAVLLVLVMGVAALRLATPEILSPLGNIILSASLSLKTVGLAVGSLFGHGSVLLRIIRDTLLSVSPLYWVGAGLWVIAFDLFCGWVIRRSRAGVSS